MRRVASNIVYVNKIEFYKNHIVELYNNIVINHYALSEELQMTEWFSGTIIIYNRAAYLIKRQISNEEVNDIYELLSSSSELSTDDCSRYGYIERL